MTAPLGTAAAVAEVTAVASVTGVVGEVVTTGAEEISIAGIPDGEFSGCVRETYAKNVCSVPTRCCLFSLLMYRVVFH